MNLTGRPIFQKTPQHRFTPLERRYYAWLHANCTCCLTGYDPFEIAHTGPKTALTLKAPLSTCLPLRQELHHIEERGRLAFWARVGLSDHLAWAARLYDIFEANDNPLTLLQDMQDRADRVVISDMLTGVL